MLMPHLIRTVLAGLGASGASLLMEPPVWTVLAAYVGGTNLGLIASAMTAISSAQSG